MIRSFIALIMQIMMRIANKQLNDGIVKSRKTTENQIPSKEEGREK